MMRRSRSVSVGLVLAVAAVSPLAVQAATYTHFTSPIFHFSMDYPSAWHIKADRAKGLEEFRVNQNEGLAVYYGLLASAPTLRRLTGLTAATLRKGGYTTGKITYAGGRSTFGGTGSAGSVHGKYRAVVVVRGRVFYLILATASNAYWAQVLPTFRYMIASFSPT